MKCCNDLKMPTCVLSDIQNYDDFQCFDLLYSNLKGWE